MNDGRGKGRQERMAFVFFHERGLGVGELVGVGRVRARAAWERGSMRVSRWV